MAKNETPETESAETVAKKTPVDPNRTYTTADLARYNQTGAALLDVPEINRPLQSLSNQYVRGRAARDPYTYRELCLLAGILAEYFQK